MNPVNPVHPINPVNPVHPINPVNPDNPVNPVNSRPTRSTTQIKKYLSSDRQRRTVGDNAAQPPFNPPLQPMVLNRILREIPLGPRRGRSPWSAVSHAPRCIYAMLCLSGLMLLPVGAIAAAIYNPIPIKTGETISDRLTNQDIPTGQSGFARDYVVQLREGSQIAIDLTSDNFDTIVSLLANDGSTVAENDDGPDGSTNSLLFTRITKTGTYYIRVRAFGELADGKFKLKLSSLQAQ